MTRNARYVVNAVVLLLIGAHGIYRFASERALLDADGLALGLVVAQIVVGIGGAIWFFMRSRSVSG
ncbi:MAG TPA: hypothetical protein VFL84_06250 [Gammaproteobacteria bacterium]|nr:hypothetical protein [Gammaproteobacteria bacterium]